MEHSWENHIGFLIGIKSTIGIEDQFIYMVQWFSEKNIFHFFWYVSSFSDKKFSRKTQNDANLFSVVIRFTMDNSNTPLIGSKIISSFDLDITKFCIFYTILTWRIIRHQIFRFSTHTTSSFLHRSFPSSFSGWWQGVSIGIWISGKQNGIFTLQ